LYKLASFSASSAVSAFEGGIGLPPRLTLPPAAAAPAPATSALSLLLLLLVSSTAPVETTPADPLLRTTSLPAAAGAALWRLWLLNRPVLCSSGCVLGEAHGAAALGDALG
jgi:hypothetical protein